MRKSACTIALVMILASMRVPAQTEPLALHTERVKALQNRRETAAAFDFIDKTRDQILREWIAITEINAPSGQEKQRAAYLQRLLRKLGLKNIHYDSVGNLIAARGIKKIILLELALAELSR